MRQHITSQILDAVSEKMAQGYGLKRNGETDCFDSTITLEGKRYHVTVEWPDGAESHELTPEIESF